MQDRLTRRKVERLKKLKAQAIKEKSFVLKTAEVAYPVVSCEWNDCTIRGVPFQTITVIKNKGARAVNCPACGGRITCKAIN